MKTIKEILAAAGWTKTDAAALGTVRTFAGSKDLMLTPRTAAIGSPVALRSVLPAGARVVLGGENGAVEYSPKSAAGYVRISAALDFDSPISVLRDLIEAGAQIEA